MPPPSPLLGTHFPWRDSQCRYLRGTGLCWRAPLLSSPQECCSCCSASAVSAVAFVYWECTARRSWLLSVAVVILAQDEEDKASEFLFSIPSELNGWTLKGKGGAGKVGEQHLAYLATALGPRRCLIHCLRCRDRRESHSFAGSG